MSLLELHEHVTARLAAAGVTAQVVFGEREPTKQINQGPGRANRVVIVPGDDGGGLGSYDGAVKPGRNPRPLWNWRIAARVYVWAYDGSASRDERAQWSAVVELHDLVIEAIHSYAAGFYTISSPKRLGPIECKFGYELVFRLELGQPVLATRRPRTEGPVQPQGTTLLVTPSGEEPGC